MRVRETVSSQARKGSPTRRVSSGIRKISSSAMLSEAADRMKRLGADRLPVIEDNEIVGWITEDGIAGAVSAGMDRTTTPVKHATTPRSHVAPGKTASAEPLK